MQKVYKKISEIQNSILVVEASGIEIGEKARIEPQSGGEAVYASVISFERDRVFLQPYCDTKGLNTGDSVIFLKEFMKTYVGDSLLGRRFSAQGFPIDGGPIPEGILEEIGTPTANPVCRTIPKEMIRTNIPMIDLYNTLVKSQKIPVFSIAGEPYNQLLQRISNQTDADVVVIGGVGFRHDDLTSFIENAEEHGSIEKTVMFVQMATDPAVEALLVPDMALTAAEAYATKGKNVLVLLTDMTLYADALKEVSIGLGNLPSQRGYSSDLYSQLAFRYEKAIDIEGSGSITLIAVTTMPGDDVTHPVPDNTGYITEGQFYLKGGRIEPFGSLSRLKQLVIGESTPEDHGPIMNATIRLYAEVQRTRELLSMGFRLSVWDEKLLKYGKLFEETMMNLEVNISLEDALKKAWDILGECFDPREVGIKQALIDKFWPKHQEA